MRCKNCGTENDDNRYICETCGSPLYDEQEVKSSQGNKNVSEPTQTFKAVSGKDETRRLNKGRATAASNQGGGTAQGRNTPEKKSTADEKNSTAEKKSIAVIIVLAIVLIAIIASVIAIAGGRSDDGEEETSELTKISTTESTRTTTRSRTTEEDDSEDETEKTTEKTTASTTQKLWIINVSSSGGGSVSGDGEYANGDSVTLKATPDDGYEFDGWYSNGVKVSGDSEYTFKANENASFSAVFNPVTTQTTTTTTTAPATPSDPTMTTGTADNEISFG